MLRGCYAVLLVTPWRHVESIREPCKRSWSSLDRDAARKPLEIANATEAKRCRTTASTSRSSTAPFLFQEGGSSAEYHAELELAITRGWLWLHESRTYVKFTPAGADLFA